jgi:hypothetical protein
MLDIMIVENIWHNKTLRTKWFLDKKTVVFENQTKKHDEPKILSEEFEWGLKKSECMPQRTSFYLVNDTPVGKKCFLKSMFENMCFKTMFYNISNLEIYTWI